MEKSIPLYRFLGGKTVENVIIAMKGIEHQTVTANFRLINDFHKFIHKF